jgi:hypothetical protein
MRILVPHLTQSSLVIYTMDGMKCHINQLEVANRQSLPIRIEDCRLKNEMFYPFLSIKIRAIG